LQLEQFKIFLYFIIFDVKKIMIMMILLLIRIYNTKCILLYQFIARCNDFIFIFTIQFFSHVGGSTNKRRQKITSQIPWL